MDVEPRLEYRVVPITDVYGPTKDDPTLQVIILANYLNFVSRCNIYYLRAQKTIQMKHS